MSPSHFWILSLSFGRLFPENRFIYTDPSQVVETARFPTAYPAHYVAKYVIQRPAKHAASAILLSFTDYFVSPWSLLEVW